jgi:hypothetical protein
METFEITFLNKPCNGESSFVKYTETFLIAAIVTKSEEGLTDRFHITLKDIGLNSLYGEFDILRKNGMWQTSDRDSAELINLKRDIIIELLIQNK